MAVLVFLAVLILCGVGAEDALWWTPVDRASLREMVRVTLAMKQVNVEWLKETLLAVSSPDSSRYGQHLTMDQINKHVHPTLESVSAVKNFFESRNIAPQFTRGNGHAVVDLPTAVAEEVFSTTLYNYRHANKEDWTVTRAAAPAVLPSALSPHVAFACCLDTFPQPRSRPLTNYSFPDVSVDPNFIDKEYNVGGYVGSNKNNSQAVAGFLKQYFSHKDLASFQERYSIPSNPIAKVVGKNTEGDPGSEASLDVQYITGKGPSSLH